MSSTPRQPNDHASIADVHLESPKKFLWCSVLQRRFHNTFLLGLVNMNSLVWIAKLNQAQDTQDHPQQVWQNEDIMAKLLAENRVAPMRWAHA